MRKNYHQWRWNDVKNIKKSLSRLINQYLAGEIEAEVLRNVVYAANCLLSACKQITDEEMQELKDMVEQIKKEEK